MSSLTPAGPESGAADDRTDLPFDPAPTDSFSAESSASFFDDAGASHGPADQWYDAPAGGAEFDSGAESSADFDAPAADVPDGSAAADAEAGKSDGEHAPADGEADGDAAAGASAPAKKSRRKTSTGRSSKASKASKTAKTGKAQPPEPVESAGAESGEAAVSEATAEEPSAPAARAPRRPRGGKARSRGKRAAAAPETETQAAEEEHNLSVDPALAVSTPADGDGEEPRHWQSLEGEAPEGDSGALDSVRPERRRAKPKRQAPEGGFELAVPVEPVPSQGQRTGGTRAEAPAAGTTSGLDPRRGRNRGESGGERGNAGGTGRGQAGATWKQRAERVEPEADERLLSAESYDDLGFRGSLSADAPEAEEGDVQGGRRRRVARKPGRALPARQPAETVGDWQVESEPEYAEQPQGDETSHPWGRFPADRGEGDAARSTQRERFPLDEEQESADDRSLGIAPLDAPPAGRPVARRRQRFGAAPQEPQRLSPEAPDLDLEEAPEAAQGEGGNEDAIGVELESGQARRGRRRGGRRRRERRERARQRSGEQPGQGQFSEEAAGPALRPPQAPDQPVAVESIPGEYDDALPEEGIDLADLRQPHQPLGVGLGRVRHGGRPQPASEAAFEPAGDMGEEAAGRGARRRRRGRGAGVAHDPLAPRSMPQVPRDQTILVNAADAEETRVVVVEGGRIVDLQMTVEKHKSYVNDIYRGRVVNLETAIGAAFVDFGQGRNGFLHASDVMDFYGDQDFALERLLTARTEASDWEAKGVQAEEVEDSAQDGREGEDDQRAARPKRGSAAQKSRRVRRRNINELLEKGQLVVVQITKDAIGDKGPTLTTYVSIPGRYLVLMPSLQRTGVSRKIEDERERRRLKKILQELEIPEGMGVIVRTAGVGKTSEEIKRDLDYLLAMWSTFSTKLVLGRSPAPLYQESEVSIRTMRDLFSARTEAVIVDDPKVYEQMLDFTRRLMPEHVDRVQLHNNSKPLFHAYSVEQDFERIFSRRVDLPSGGSIVIDQTEALVAIDVNSGRTRDEGADFEDIALKTNLEAAPEIARQIKLRDMGGILVVDFIDMLRPNSRRLVEKAFTECLEQDRARSKVGRISQFGLLELTRQRLGPGLSKLVYEPCPTCKGSGRRRTAQSRAQAVLRRLASALNQKGFTRIEVRAHPDTVHWLEEHDRAELDQLRDGFKREIVLASVENQSEDSVFHYMRADGREVRPGGRRKR